MKRLLASLVALILLALACNFEGVDDSLPPPAETPTARATAPPAASRLPLPAAH